NLASFNLSGSLPDISSMDALEIIDLHNNRLKGTIPNFLGTMRNLQHLNLADNQFSGPIPTSLSTNNKLTLNVTGNPSLCAPDKSCSSSPADNTPATKKKKKSMLPLILYITIPILVLVLVLVAVIAFCFLFKKTTPPNANMPVVPG
nr:malectin-like carbohydrate-binding domain-containing protein [Tanacetum cinerariifolium]